MGYPSILARSLSLACTVCSPLVPRVTGATKRSRQPRLRDPLEADGRDMAIRALETWSSPIWPFRESFEPSLKLPDARPTLPEFSTQLETVLFLAIIINVPIQNLATMPEVPALGQALVSFSVDGLFPEENISSLALSSDELPEAIQALSDAKSKLEVHFRRRHG